MQYPVRMFSVESASVADHKCAYPYARNVSGLFYLLKCLFQAFREPFARFQPVAYGGAVSYVQLKIPDFFAACQLGKAFQVFFQLYSVKVLVAVIPGAPVIACGIKSLADMFLPISSAAFSRPSSMEGVRRNLSLSKMTCSLPVFSIRAPTDSDSSVSLLCLPLPSVYLTFSRASPHRRSHSASAKPDRW